MVKTDVILDTGPLIGLLSKRDQYHTWAKQQTAHLKEPFYTCEAVLSEATHLLERTPVRHLLVVDLLERDLIEVPFVYSAHAGRVHMLMRAYADQPMSFADACLVCMAERRAASTIFTTDADFRVYRHKGDPPQNVLTPGSQ